MSKVEEAVAAWRKAREAFAAHAKEATRLKEVEVVARHTGGDADSAEAAYKKHQDGWYDHWRAEESAAKGIADALGLTDGERRELGSKLR